MSDLNKLKELAERCDSMRVSVDQNAAYVNFISCIEPKDVVTLFERLEAAQQRIAELEAEAEREDGITIDALESKREWRLRAEKAEAELARRDKEAGEPVGELHSIQRGLTRQVEVKWINGSPPPKGTKLFTAAQPAALPPEVDNWHNPASGIMKAMQFNGDEISFTIGANWMREKSKALGVKPLSVKLTARYDIAETSGNPFASYRCIEEDEDGDYLNRDEVIASLKSQGFTVEGE